MEAVGGIINHSEIYHETEWKCQTATNPNSFCRDRKNTHTETDWRDFLKTWSMMSPDWLEVRTFHMPHAQLLCTVLSHVFFSHCRNLFPRSSSAQITINHKVKTLASASSIIWRGGGEPVGGWGGEGKREVKHGGVSCEKWLKIGPKIRGWKVGGAVWI